MVEAKLETRCSPEQVAGWLVEDFPDDPEMRVSRETLRLWSLGRWVQFTLRR